MWYNSCVKLEGSFLPRNMGARQAVLLNSLESALPACLPFYKQIALINPLESAFTGSFQIIENTATLTPAESALTDIPSVTSLESALTENRGGGLSIRYPYLESSIRVSCRNCTLNTPKRKTRPFPFNSLRTLLHL
jgi:hypothetical protein